MPARAHDSPSTPSGRHVLGIGFLMTGAFSARFTEALQVSLDLTWFLPVLAGWLAAWHGIGVLRAWWPLALLPSLGLTLDAGIGLRFGVSNATLLLSLIIAAAVDRRFALPPPRRWLRGDTVFPVTVGFCLLVVAALDLVPWRVVSPPGEVRLNLLAIPAALILLPAIRWEALAAAVWPGRPRQTVGAAAILGAALVLAGLASTGSVSLGAAVIRYGTFSLATLVPIVCFGLVLLGCCRPIVVAALLVAGLIIDRLFALAIGTSLEPMITAAEWPRLAWDGLLGSLAAIPAGRAFRVFIAPGGRGLPAAAAITQLALAWIAVLLITPLLTGFTAPSHGSALWLVAAISFAAGICWRAHSLAFVPPLLMCVWLLAAMIAPAGLGGGAAGPLATIGLVSFPFAFCGAFLAMSRELAPLASPGGGPAASAPAPAEAIALIDVSPLAEIVEQVDRSATWRSFLVAAAPFVVLWQLFEVYGAHRFVEQASASFGGEPLLEDWHYAVGALLALAPLGFAFWDWLDRQDRFRLLALVSGCVVGAVVWQLLGGLLGYLTSTLIDEFGDEPVMIVGVFVYLVLVLGSGLLAGTDRRIARPVFLSLAGVLAAATLAGIGWLWTQGDRDVAELLGTLALVGALAFIGLALARFVNLRLVLASDRPRELLFGAHRDTGFWVRMAAASGLPSSAWRLGALKMPAFWALFLARFVVYTGGVLARAWPVLGAVVILIGHGLFHAGKRLSAREMWRPAEASGSDRPILFLRGFDDDQCTFPRRPWDLPARWLDLWSFRQNLDEALVDELAQFGPVIALGRPGDKRTPFGAQRHYADHADWQHTLAAAARSAQAIVLVASDSPGVKWEYDLLKNEAMLDKVLLVFRPDPAHLAANRHAAEWFSAGGGAKVDEAIAAGLRPVSLRRDKGRALLSAAKMPSAAASVLSLRVHFHGEGAR
ncbi:MAG TPA: hypothetical protein GX403_13220 [Rhodocyclaceae bacterium]|nr:hypothetical protein [Rhodocyclaceae bacterium]